MNHSAVALLIHDKKILLFLRDDVSTIENPNKWGLVGGHGEEGETAEMTIKRELKEEINVVPENLQYIGSIKNQGGKLSVFIGRFNDGEAAQIKLGDEGQAVKFFSLREVSNLNLVDDLRYYISKYNEYLKYIIENDVIIDITKFGLS